MVRALQCFPGICQVFSDAFLSTMDIKAAILIIVLVILDMVIYFPFFKIYEKSLVKMETGEEE